MQTVSFAGSNYSIPNTRGDRPWSGLSDFVIAAASKAINTAGGNFTLLADLNFGASFGLVSAYFTSRTASAASAGAVRLAKTDVISWRNNAGGANIDLSKNTSNELLWNGSRIILAGGGLIVNADVSASAAIALTKLQLVSPYQWLTATSGGVISVTGVTGSRAVATDSNGLPVASATTATELGYVSGVSSAIQTQIDGTVKTTGVQSIAGAKTFTDPITQDDTTNQIVLGTTRTVTLNAPTPASSSRVVTIPDLSAAYSVVGTEGTQTINGNKTLSGTINLSALTATRVVQLDGSKNLVSTIFPAFSAFGDTTGIVTSTFTKCTFTSEEFDTNSNFASSTFTPTVAGYYRISARLFYGTLTSARLICSIYKNGAEFKRGDDQVMALQGSIGVDAVVLMNGSTDALEIWTFQADGVNRNISTNAGTTAYFQGTLVVPT